ncbi:MAG: proline dehydrogenase family protein [Halobacteriales archaeon]|nr:proline dehydrogenase family protein [Halobacteriales archaeon]
MIPPVARRFVAGETREGAIERARALNDRGIGAILNLLGEHYGERASADADVAAYRALLDAVDEAGVRARLSVKPSQLGLRVGETVFRENARAVVEAAVEHDAFVWFDMEDRRTTDATLDAFEAMTEVHPDGVGVCLQANLKRTPDDLDRLAGLPGRFRLVKGAYDEPAAVAHADRRRVNRAYRELLGQAIREHDGGVAVGSHDPEMVDHAIGLAADHGTDLEIQMLMGVREDAQTALAADHEVWQYVPYGSRWLSYFWRRVTERKGNLLFALRAVLGR